MAKHGKAYLDAKQRWLVEMEVKPGDSEGGGANASGRSLTTQTKVTTRFGVVCSLQ